jgi:hypothetical protein
MIRSQFTAAILVVACAAGCQNTGVDLPIPGLSGPRLSDVQQIEMVLDDVHSGMESRRIYKVLAHVSRAYYDSEGRDYPAIQAYLSNLFERYRDIRITRTRPQIQVQGNRAQALEAFGTSADAANPDQDLDIRLQGQVMVFLERVDGEWKIREWGPIQ